MERSSTVKNRMLNNDITKRLVFLNRYYKMTKFYSFLKSTAYRGVIGIIFFVLLLVGLEYFFFDFNAILNNLVEAYSPAAIISFFLASETILGIVPPEIFIAWSAKTASPWFFLFLLATVSYIGGVLSYLIGKLLFLIPSFKNQIENKIAKHINNLRKWGGMFVLIGAISPVPHSIVSMASGLIKYDFKKYLLWSLFRYSRFLIYALVIFQVFA